MRMDKKTPFLGHLEELRKRLFVVLAGFTVSFAVSLFFAPRFLEFLLSPIRSQMERVYFMAPEEGFMVTLAAAFFLAVILSFPLFFSQAWLFLEPGLAEKEKRLFLPVLFASLGLFLTGVFFSFFLILPVSLKFFLGFAGETLKPFISVGKYISFVTNLCLGFGLAFISPVFLLALLKMGAISRETLKRQRPFVVVLIFVIAAIMTPSTDIISQTAMALPLWLLFEGTLLVSRWVVPRHA